MTDRNKIIRKIIKEQVVPRILSEPPRITGEPSRIFPEPSKPVLDAETLRKYQQDSAAHPDVPDGTSLTLGDGTNWVKHEGSWVDSEGGNFANVDTAAELNSTYGIQNYLKTGKMLGDESTYTPDVLERVKKLKVISDLHKKAMGAMSGGPRLTPQELSTLNDFQTKHGNPKLPDSLADDNSKSPIVSPEKTFIDRIKDAIQQKQPETQQNKLPEDDFRDRPPNKPGAGLEDVVINKPKDDDISRPQDDQTKKPKDDQTKKPQEDETKKPKDDTLSKIMRVIPFSKFNDLSLPSSYPGFRPGQQTHEIPAGGSAAVNPFGVGFNQNGEMIHADGLPTLPRLNKQN